VTDEELIEAAAKTIFLEGDSAREWDEYPEEIREYWRRYARAAFEVFKSARQDDWEYTTADWDGSPDMARYRNWGSAPAGIAAFRRHHATEWEPVPDTEGAEQ
jgi:hypothetical protein